MAHLECHLISVTLVPHDFTGNRTLEDIREAIVGAVVMLEQLPYNYGMQNVA